MKNSILIAALPEFVKRPEDVTTKINGAAKLQCSARGHPQPSIYWFKEGSQILMFPNNSYSGNIYISPEGALEIQKIQKSDAGYYVCSAFSIAGSDTARAMLQVSAGCLEI